MAKKNVSARVPPQIADAIDEFAETWDITRTEAMTAILRNGLENPPNPRKMGAEVEVNPTENVYTVELEPENAEAVDEAMEKNDEEAGEVLDRVLSIYR